MGMEEQQSCLFWGACWGGLVGVLQEIERDLDEGEICEYFTNEQINQQLTGFKDKAKAGSKERRWGVFPLGEQTNKGPKEHRKADTLLVW